MTSQLDLSLGSTAATKRANKISRAASRKRHRLPVLQSSMPVADETFMPVKGVPRTRGECPTTGLCVHTSCRFHLFRVDAENRAGRPGLSKVPRDPETGLTLSTPGSTGTERPGTTLRPGWLKVRGLEVEREVKVYVTKTEDGYELNETRNGTLDYWLKHTHAGEALLAYDTVTLGLGDEPLLLAQCEFTSDRRVRFDRELPEYVINGSSALLLTRVRRVASCALDEIDRHGRMSNEQVGDAIARHRTLIGREVRVALRRAVEEGQRRGIEPNDLIASLESMAEVKK